MLELCAQVTFPFRILFLVDVMYQYISRFFPEPSSWGSMWGGIQNAMENKIGTLIMISKLIRTTQLS